MSDYDQIPRFLGLLLITAPLWLPIWTIWWIFDKLFSKKEEIKQVEKVKFIPPPYKPRPILFKSISEKNKILKDLK
jgi:hypothetical protein